MKLSNSYFYTLREEVKDEESISGKLLVKAGMIKKSSSGIYMFLPLGLKVLENIKKIIREEMNNAQCNELLMPILTNEDYFEKSGRKSLFGSDMFKVNDRYNKPYALGPTHEEVFTTAASFKIRSYKDMPFNIYQFGIKFRDEIRPRFGLIRVREFLMKDAYSFDIDEETCDKSYNLMKSTYENIMKRCDLDYRIVKADVGVMGGNLSEEFQAITDIGEDIIVTCSCGYSSNLEVAKLLAYEKELEEPKEMKMVETPNMKTIDEICEGLKIDESRTVKSLVYNIDGEITLILVKGNRELNETKLQKLLDAKSIIMATEEELKTITDATFGSLGPINIKAPIIIDNEVEKMSNFVVGANKDGYHYINVNLKDFDVKQVGDIVNIREGDLCPNCKKTLTFTKGIEVGNIFKLGDKYTKSLNVKYLDEHNKEQYPVMGCYGIGLGRILAAAIEQHNDEFGIVFPYEIAPFKVCIVVVNKDNNDIAEKLYNDIKALNIDVLLDDRDERVGVKFKDMDLIGIPYKITIGKKASEKIFEFKKRDEKEYKEMTEEEILTYLKSIN